jgi:hypothetical protein
MSAHEPGTNDTIDTSNPWIVIPYFSGDEGRQGIERPLTGIFYLCPSIKVKGVNYTAVPGTYIPDEPLSIIVDVSNLGVPTAQVTVDVYWADPSTAFVNPTWIASTTFPVAGRAVSGSIPIPTSSNEMIWTPEQTKIPPHFCLLAHATAYPPEPDPGPTTPDPVSDRHWAQYNLQTATLPPSNKLISVFWSANPERESAAFMVTARPVSKEGLKLLARVVRAEPVASKHEQIMLGRATAEGRERGSRQDSLVLELERGARQPLIVSVHAPELAPHQFTAVEVVQTRLGNERGEGTATGGLAIVIFPAAERQ